MTEQATREHVATLEQLLLTLPDHHQEHAPGSSFHARVSAAVDPVIRQLFFAREAVPQPFPPFGSLVFPYREMGAVTSLDLFQLDELILFSFYWKNRERYHTVADLGANIGLHSILLAKAGYDVVSYEPDPEHVEALRENLEINACDLVRVKHAAVSTRKDTLDFIRVLGNTTANHLAGAKSNPYGDLETVQVATEDIRDVLAWADLVKLDVEGHERDLIVATNRSDWEQCDALVEIGGAEHARDIFSHLDEQGVRLFSQKKNWQQATRASDVPTHYSEGLLFVSVREEMPW